MSQKLIWWEACSLTTFLRINSVGERTLLPRRTVDSTFYHDIRYLTFCHSARVCSLQTETACTALLHHLHHMT